MTAARAFVLHQTRLRPVPGLPGIRLHLADDVLALWGAVQAATGEPDAPLPYWAFAWAGGLAIAHYLVDHPETVADARVVDVASGSGLCALAALGAGARTVEAIDVDPLAAAAISLNARAAGRRLAVVRRDVLDEDPPPADVILAGDCCYEADLAARVLPWLRRAADRGTRILLGDPGRRYLPRAELIELAGYEVRTTTELEDLARKQAAVYSLAPSALAPSALAPAALAPKR
ncbi:MAG TPA: 50S ribosomal protein L11 methyltransferase [Candidatus Limnocylindrales bacterium]|nr:50S ribosomal protein L11 methyltransferase [Candidatus Limnocylindrales bacterium]